MGCAISEGIRKAKTACRATGNKIKKYTDAAIALKLILLDCLVGSVLMCGLHIIPLHRSRIIQIQSFYSRCIRSLLQERCTELGKKPLIDYTLIEQYNIPAVESIIQHLLYRMYISWKTALSISYTNNAQYMHNRIEHINRNRGTEYGNQ